MTNSIVIGELPDVQIKFKDLLLPLEVLASADYNISRLLFSSLVVCIVQTNKPKVSYITNIELNGFILTPPFFYRILTTKMHLYKIFKEILMIVH